MTEADLLFAGGTLIGSDGRRRADIAVADGRIQAVGTGTIRARRTVDVTGLLVMPGGVDTHVHLMDPGSPEREDFPAGTRAAAAAGVTTIIEHSHGNPVLTVDDLDRKREYLAGRSNVDYGLAAHAWPGRADEVEGLWRAGVAFFKVFTCTTHGVEGHDADALKSHLLATALIDGVSLIHCEDQSLTGGAERALRDLGRVDPGLLPEWRNRDAELVAAVVAAILVRRTGARATIAHVSHPEVVSYLAGERSRGARVAAECCPQYFLLREKDVIEHGALRKFTPPARARTDDDEHQMWQLLRDGVLTHISSDHAPSTLAQKRDGDFWSVHFGLPGIDSTMSVLLDAAARGELAYEDVVRAYSEFPAKQYGLWPRKGRIAAGADADILVVDPDATRVLRNDEVLSRAGWTPFDGRTMRGRVLQTYLRGELIAENSEPVDGRGGRFLPGAGVRV
jgi:dihydroorotase (multifunctional complex type)